jgi:glucose-6-phosphate isomerase
MSTNLFTIGLGGVIGDGTRLPLIAESEIMLLEKSLRKAESHLRIHSERGTMGYGWMKLPYADIEPLRLVARKLEDYDSIVQVGIGGSALGNLMLNNAFLHPFHNELTRKERKSPRFYMADNPDPLSLSGIWDCVDPERTAFVVVSKSGSTAETIAIFLWFFEAMRQRLGEEKALSHFVFITDPKKGILRDLASRGAMATLPVPENVGGRFSVFSEVGLLSASAMGLPVKDLLEGAKLLDERLIRVDGIWDNPAWILAALHVLHFRKGRPMAVMMPYGDGLERFAEWHAQLWGESLGKEGKGSTPVRALGAIDQHSQVQLYVAGPDDKLFTLIDIAEKGPDLKIPSTAQKELAASRYLEGHSFSELLSVEARSTAAALMKAQKPVIWLEIPNLDGIRLGALVFLYEVVTALTGILLEVDPFDQPGVEQGKRYTYGLMGREGYGADAKEAAEAFGKTLSKTLSV